MFHGHVLQIVPRGTLWNIRAFEPSPLRVKRICWIEPVLNDLGLQ
jgi:hypothetical protein